MVKKIDYGKILEEGTRISACRLTNIYVYRIPDQVSKFKGSTNPCDFFFFRFPYIYFLECKATAEDDFYFSQIADCQIKGLSASENIQGIQGGLLIWFYKRQALCYVSIGYIKYLMSCGVKKVSYDHIDSNQAIHRVYFKMEKEYPVFDFCQLLDHMEGV